MSQLDEIKARAEKATPGPWEIDAHDKSPLESINSTADNRIGGWVEVARSIGDDAEFIAHARTDVPKLVAALEAVEHKLRLLDAAEEPFMGRHNVNAAGTASVLRQAIREALA